MLAVIHSEKNASNDLNGENKSDGASTINLDSDNSTQLDNNTNLTLLVQTNDDDNNNSSRSNK